MNKGTGFGLGLLMLALSAFGNDGVSDGCQDAFGNDPMLIGYKLFDVEVSTLAGTVKRNVVMCGASIRSSFGELQREQHKSIQYIRLVSPYLRQQSRLYLYDLQGGGVSMLSTSDFYVPGIERGILLLTAMVNSEEKFGDRTEYEFSLRFLEQLGSTKDNREYVEFTFVLIKHGDGSVEPILPDEGMIFDKITIKVGAPKKRLNEIVFDSKGDESNFVLKTNQIYYRYESPYDLVAMQRRRDEIRAEEQYAQLGGGSHQFSR